MNVGKYVRAYGDNLLSKDSRLKYRWKWNRIASRVSSEEIKKWTHFQTSFCRIDSWTLKAIQWSKGDGVTYEAEIIYVSDHITSRSQFKTRLDAQIGAEQLLIDWIRRQYYKYAT